MRGKLARVLAVGVPAAFCASLCLAADLSRLPLENLLDVEVEGPSRFAQPLSEAPASVSVVSADEIRRFGFRNLAEALQSMRGVHTSYEHDYTYIGIRGLARPGDYNSRMLLMTDGTRRNDPLYDSAMIGNEAPIEIDWVKRLEFVPGSASSLYGANAVMGVANAVLWSGRDIEGTHITAHAGSGNTLHVGLLSGRGLDSGGEWLFGFSAQERKGENLHFDEFDVPGSSDGIAHRRDAERHMKVIAKVSAGGWQGAAGYSVRRKNVPTGYYDTAFDAPGTFITDQYAYADVSHSRSLGDSLSQTIHVHAAQYDFDGQYEYAGLTNRDKAGAAWGGFEYLLTYTGAKNHKLLVGAEFQRRQKLDQRNYDVSPEAWHLVDTRKNNSAGLFVNDEWRIGLRWLANLGLRTDRSAGFAATSPRAALIFRPVPQAALKLIYSKAFRPPNNYERYYNDGEVLQKANLDLQAEHIATRELVADYVFSPRFRLSGTYYRYTVTGLIDQITDNDGLLVFINRDPVRGEGVEVETELTLTQDVRLKGSLTRQQLEQSFGAAVNSPKWIGKLFIDGPVFDTGWNLGVGIQAMSRRQSFNGEVPGHVFGNLVLRHRTADRSGEWRVGVYNISGHRYLDPASAAVARGAVAQEGRQVRLTWEQAY